MGQVLAQHLLEHGPETRLVPRVSFGRKSGAEVGLGLRFRLRLHLGGETHLLQQFSPRGAARLLFLLRWITKEQYLLQRRYRRRRARTADSGETAVSSRDGGVALDCVVEDLVDQAWRTLVLRLGELDGLLRLLALCLLLVYQLWDQLLHGGEGRQRLLSWRALPLLYRLLL